MAQKKPFLFTLRKHKKKSIFFAALGLWGTNYGVQQFRDYLERRKFCYEGKIHGDEKIPAVGKPRKLLLFLNPEANNGKALKSYERNAAPILHLGGLEITTVKTDYEGQCKALTQYLDPTIDGIIVAGGDGTLLEVLTGLLRRNDQEKISKIPIGLIPVGKNNHSYNNIMDDTSDKEVRKIANAALNILKWETRNVSVMEIKNWAITQWREDMDERSERSTEGRPTYAVDRIEWGPLRDAKENQRFWWTGPLKRRLPYIFQTLKKWPPKFAAKFTNESLTSAKTNDINTIFLFGFFVKLLQNSTESYLHTSIFPANLKKLDFITCGWKLEAGGKLSNQNIKTAETKEFELQPLEDETSWYTIDGEKFEARPIQVKILPDKIRVFCSSA